MIAFQGTNISPQWQNWANIAEMPSYSGPVTLQEESTATFACGPASGTIGCTSSVASGWLIQISVLPDPFTLQGSEYHEEGHVYDWTELTDTDRQAFMNLWSLPGGASNWWTVFPNGIGAPGEWWAEGYRLCSRWGANMPDSAVVSDYTVYAYPGLKQPAIQRQVCQLILAIGARQGLAAPGQAIYPAAYPPNPATYPAEWPAQPAPTVTQTTLPPTKVATPSPAAHRRHHRRHRRHHHHHRRIAR